MLANLTRKLQIVRYAPADTILGQGELPARLYIVTRGEVDVIRREECGQETRLSTLSAGEYFGELGLLHPAPCTASVRARTAVELLVLDHRTLQEIIKTSGAAAHMLAEV
jgi:ATP-binding cassette, subfamily B, bacterial